MSFGRYLNLCEKPPLSAEGYMSRQPCPMDLTDSQ